MRYLGGKARVGKKITAIINSIPASGYWEPFVGGGWVIKDVKTRPAYATDINNYLISLWQSIQRGWLPPGEITENMYLEIKNNKENYPKELVAFVGFGCSFGGKWFGGYCRDGTGRNYAANAKNSLLSKMRTLGNVNFDEKDFCTSSENMKGWVIYCDPPYQNTTRYDFRSDFRHDVFWQKCREYSHDNFVLISEYQCPQDFVELASYPTKTDMRVKDGSREDRMEKLFCTETTLKNLQKLGVFHEAA